MAGEGTPWDGVRNALLAEMELEGRLPRNSVGECLGPYELSPGAGGRPELCISAPKSPRSQFPRHASDKGPCPGSVKTPTARWWKDTRPSERGEKRFGRTLQQRARGHGWKRRWCHPSPGSEPQIRTRGTGRLHAWQRLRWSQEPWRGRGAAIRTAGRGPLRKPVHSELGCTPPGPSTPA